MADAALAARIVKDRIVDLSKLTPLRQPDAALVEISWLCVRRIASGGSLFG
jgi:hypothetical protein